MVHAQSDQSASSERQEVIDWFQTHNYLPTSTFKTLEYHKMAQLNPKQGAWSHLIPLTRQLWIPLYTGKNPSI